jgi:serine/threonine-protein phosphatase 5
MNDKDAFAFGNRSLVNIYLKNFKSAVDDATHALELNDKYVKAYHRRGQAYLSLCK